MVQQVRDRYEEGGTAVTQTAVHNGGSQMSLAAAAGPPEQQPSLRPNGKDQAGLVGTAKTVPVLGIRVLTLGDQVVESESSKGSDIAVPLELIEPALLPPLTQAAARHGPPVVRVAERDV